MKVLWEETSVDVINIMPLALPGSLREDKCFYQFFKTAGNLREFSKRNSLPAHSLRISSHEGIIWRIIFVISTSIYPASNDPRCSDSTSNPKIAFSEAVCAGGTPHGRSKQ